MVVDEQECAAASASRATSRYSPPASTSSASPRFGRSVSGRRPTRRLERSPRRVETTLQPAAAAEGSARLRRAFQDGGARAAAPYDLAQSGRPALPRALARGSRGPRQFDTTLLVVVGAARAVVAAVVAARGAV